MVNITDVNKIVQDNEAKSRAEKQKKYDCAATQVITAFGEDLIDAVIMNDCAKGYSESVIECENFYELSNVSEADSSKIDLFPEAATPLDRHIKTLWDGYKHNGFSVCWKVRKEMRAYRYILKIRWK